MSTLGQRLRDQRESRRLSRANVALATGIRAHQLSSVEHGNFDALPDEAFTGGSVRTYLEYLGLEPEETLAEILAMLDPQRLPLAVPQANTCEPGGSKEPSAAGPAHVPETVSTASSARSVAPDFTGQPSASEDSAPSRFPTAMAIVVLAAVVLGAWGLARWFGGDAGEIPFESRLASKPNDAEPGPANRASPVVPQAPEPALERTAGPDLKAAERVPQPDAKPRSGLVLESDPDPDRGAGPAGGTLSISEYGVGTGIENRQLIGKAGRFTVGTQVAFWTRVRGGRSGQQIRHVWIHEGRETDSIVLTLGAEHWRTYTRKNLFASSEGAWVVEARDSAGTVLARSDFVCLPAG